MNLQDLIKTGESDTVEFKEKFDERTIESAVAFANTKGGMIFIGVSDKNNIKGIKIGKETQQVDKSNIPEHRSPHNPGTGRDQGRWKNCHSSEN